MLTDPQRFNQYSYVRNNPLRFVDPKGEEIELTGETDEERRKQLGAIQSAVGKGGDRLEIRQDKDSGKYMVKVKNDDLAGFSKVSSQAAAFGAIIGNSEIAKFAVMSRVDPLPFSVGGQSRSLSQMSAVGATGRDSGGQLWVVVQSDRYGYPSIENSKFHPSGSDFVDWLGDRVFGVSRDIATITAHEWGHAKYSMETHGPIGSPEGNAAALQLENAVRKSRGEPIRVRH